MISAEKNDTTIGTESNAEKGENESGGTPNAKTGTALDADTKADGDANAIVDPVAAFFDTPGLLKKTVLFSGLGDINRILRTSKALSGDLGGIKIWHDFLKEHHPELHRRYAHLDSSECKHLLKEKLATEITFDSWTPVSRDIRNLPPLSAYDFMVDVKGIGSEELSIAEFVDSAVAADGRFRTSLACEKFGRIKQMLLDLPKNSSRVDAVIQVTVIEKDSKRMGALGHCWGLTLVSPTSGYEAQAESCWKHRLRHVEDDRGAFGHSHLHLGVSDRSLDVWIEFEFSDCFHSHPTRVPADIRVDGDIITDEKDFLCLLRNLIQGRMRLV